MKSLDPRVNRLPKIDFPASVSAKAPFDQLGTFEVFVQPKEEKPFQHEGALHASDVEMAFVLAKETFTRRFLCTALFVADTRDVFVSAFTDGDDSIYDHLNSAELESEQTTFEIFELHKRGKQHIHLAQLQAATPLHAMIQARSKSNPQKIVYNLWAIPTEKIRYTKQEEKEMWHTLPEKKFRDASNYKGGEKLKTFLEKNQKPS